MKLFVGFDSGVLVVRGSVRDEEGRLGDIDQVVGKDGAFGYTRRELEIIAKSTGEIEYPRPGTADAEGGN